jgi:hypothetical protein
MHPLFRRRRSAHHAGGSDKLKPSLSHTRSPATIGGGPQIESLVKLIAYKLTGQGFVLPLLQFMKTFIDKILLIIKN